MKPYAELGRIIHGSRASLADWGKAVGLSKGAVQAISDGVYSMREAPSLERVRALVADIESGKTRWVRRGRHFVLDPPYSYGPRKMNIRVDFFHSRIQMEHEFVQR